MTEEKITERDDGVTKERVVERNENDGHTTIVERRGGGAGWAIAAVMVVGIAIGAYFFMQSDARDAIQAEAVTDAAESVGDAAGEVGEAAQEAGDALQEATGN